MLFYACCSRSIPVCGRYSKATCRRQSAMLVTMSSTAVDNLDRLDLVLSAVRDLGRRHAGYGVKDSDYDTVETALLLTLATGARRRFHRRGAACLGGVLPDARRRHEGSRRRNAQSGAGRVTQPGFGGPRSSASKARASSSSRRISSSASRVFGSSASGSAGRRRGRRDGCSGGGSAGVSAGGGSASESEAANGNRLGIAARARSAARSSRCRTEQFLDAADRVAVLIKALPDAAQQQDVFRPVIAPAAAAL